MMTTTTRLTGMWSPRTSMFPEPSQVTSGGMPVMGRPSEMM